MEGQGDERGMETWRLLMEAHAVVVDGIERQLRREGGPPVTWVELLIRLAEAPEGALRMQELAEQLIFSRSGVTRLVDRMEAAGLIERASCPSDRRGTLAVITDAGREALGRTHPALHRAVEVHFARYLTESDESQLRSVLERLLEANGHHPADAAHTGPDLGRAARSTARR